MVLDIMLLILILGFVIGFILAFSMGANDVANSFGTSVGSKTLTFKQACILATIFETCGSVLLGGRVSGTIAKGIVDLKLYQDDLQQLQLGYLSALIGASGWLLLATIFKFPVSGTHSIVGAVLGFTLVANGAVGVRWLTLVKVVGSWFTSPVLSGIVSALLFLMLKFLVLRKSKKLDAGARLLPVLYGITIAANMYMILNNTFDAVHFEMPFWGLMLMAFGIGLICWVIARWILMPWILKMIARKIEKANAVAVVPSFSPELDIEFTPNSIECETPPTPTTSPLPPSFPFLTAVEMDDSGHASALSLNDSTPPHTDGQVSRADSRRSGARPVRLGHFKIKHFRTTKFKLAEITTSAGQTKVIAALSLLEVARKKEEMAEHMRVKIKKQEPDDVRHLFSCIQVVTAVFASFAHGSNDVSNAVGPIIGMFAIYHSGSLSNSNIVFHWLILLFGGCGMSVGLWMLGRRVMSTIGSDLAAASPAAGFCIEFGAALTVLIASHLGIPVSTTHCLVGSVVFVGFVRSRRKGVDWTLTRNILLSWGVTVPVACAISAAAFAGLQAIFALIPEELIMTTPAFNSSLIFNTTTPVSIVET